MNESPAERLDRTWSLRNRLLQLAMLAVAVAWILSGAAVYLVIAYESSKLFDERAREFARVFIAHEDKEIDARRSGSGDAVHFDVASQGSSYKYQIWSNTGELLHSTDTADEPMAPLDRLGFETSLINGEELRTYVDRSDDGDVRIVVAEPLRFRQSFIGNLHARFALIVLVTLPLLLVTTWWMFDRATRSLGEPAKQMVDQSPSKLRPITISSPPEELKPLISSTNELFARFAKALDSERRLTAAAAHELRTPLAAVKMQAQVALRSRSREELAGTLNSLSQGVDRASRMLDQMLTLAKLEAMDDPLRQAVDVRLEAVTAGVLQDLEPLLKKRNVRVSTVLAPARMQGIEFGLALLMRNLIDNAARHSPPHSEVVVETGTDSTHTFAMIKDSGAGIPAEERERVFGRFYRLANSNEDGAGIGLAIVRTVVELHQGRIELLDSELGGLCACVRFPKEVSPTSTVGGSPMPSNEKLSSY